MRFVAGAQFTAHRLAAWLSGRRARDLGRRTPARLYSAAPPAVRWPTGRLLRANKSSHPEADIDTQNGDTLTILCKLLKDRFGSTAIYEAVPPNRFELIAATT